MKINLSHIPNSLAARIETGPLRDAIAKLRQYGQEQSVPKTLARKLSRVLRRLVRELILTEAYNTRIWLKHDMLHDAGWRREVTEDLGGEAALERWEARKTKADRDILAPRVVPYTAGAQPEIFTPKTDAPKTPQARRIRTDASGLFRLAPITHSVRPLTPQEQIARREACKWREAMTVNTKTKPRNISNFKPIPLTPQELRGETNISRAGLVLSGSVEDKYGLPDMRADMAVAEIVRGILDFDYDISPCAQSP